MGNNTLEGTRVVQTIIRKIYVKNVILIGEEEAVGKKVKIKNMISGSEFIIDYKELFKGKI